MDGNKHQKFVQHVFVENKNLFAKNIIALKRKFMQTNDPLTQLTLK